MKNTKITANTYAKFLPEVQKYIKEAQSEIFQNVTRRKVVMAWQIGKSIDQHLLKNKKSGYGEELFKRLELDVGITKTVLYKMRSFYKAYPKLPQDDPSLNWSHYRVLAGIKEIEERKYLENLTKKNSWDSDELQLEVAQVKNRVTKISQIRAKKALKPIVKNTKKLFPTRGKLFSYQLTKFEANSKTYIDCGFKVFREWEEGFPARLEAGSQIVDVNKKDKKYSLKKSKLNPRKLNVYKAFVTRVVDGDTLHVILDLGFKIMHEEILRLKGIDAPELSTAAGKNSLRRLSKILKNVPFVIVKTFSTDIYGRYVADVFLASQSNKNSDPQQVADDGTYLNQILLDLGVVKRF